MALDWQILARMTLALTCACIALPSAAQSVPEAPPVEEEELVEDVRYYSVEFIIFEYASNVSAGNEVFDPVVPEQPEMPELDSELDAENNIPVYGDMPAGSASTSEDTTEFPDFDDVVEDEITELTTIPSLSNIEFRLLTEEELTMSEIHERLMTLDAYLPVLWGGWVQSTHEKEVTPSIGLRSLGAPPLHIDGTLTLYLRNYLHLAVDLTREQQIAVFQPVYRVEKPARNYNYRSGFEDDPSYNAADSQTIIYRIQEDRLFNSGQLRYFDHPKFGVLARVNRVEVADPDDEEEEEDSLAGRSMLSAIQ